MKRRRLLALAAALPLWSSRAAAGSTAPARDEPALPRLEDLRRDAERVRRERRPLLLSFSTPGCPYCLEVRRSYLAPRAAKPAPEALIREVDITAVRAFIGLDGKPQSEADFAAAFKVRLVPVVRLVDDRLQPLGPPLIGLNESGFYEAYLAAAIDEATRRLAGRSP